MTSPGKRIGFRIDPGSCLLYADATNIEDAPSSPGHFVVFWTNTLMPALYATIEALSRLHSYFRRGSS